MNVNDSIPNAPRSGPAAPCKACTDFRTWAKMQGKALPINEVEEPPVLNNDCPLDKDQLGRSTWGFLHTMAAHYPEKPNEQERSEMSNFFRVFAKFYPCQVCAEHFQKEMLDTPPDTCSTNTLSKWLCVMHNKVNVRLGKPEFDCSRVIERWRDGWADGSCD